MDDSKQQVDSLRWALDRQKSDYDEIQSQIRKYFAIAASIIVAAGIARIRGYWRFIDNSLSKTLAQDGLLWQNGILPPKSAPIFAEPLGMFSALVGGFGIGLTACSLLIVALIARSPRCAPMGNASVFLKRDYNEVSEWVRQNDKLIDSIDQQRIFAIRLGTNGITLLVLAAIIRFFSTKIVFVALTMALYTIIKVRTIYTSDRLLERGWRSKMLTTMLIVTAIFGPLGSYQDVYGYLPIEMRACLIAVAAIVFVYYFKSELLSTIEIARQQMVAEPSGQND